VPRLATTLKQGETKEVKVSIDRGKEFQENVKLSFEPSGKGIKVEPASPEIKAGEKEETAIKVTADKDAPLGDHTIKVTGTPEKGEKTSVDLKVTVEKGGEK
jgi:uncharacterized membrane protein